MRKLNLTHLYPLVFAVFPILTLAIYNVDQSPFQRALGPVLVSLGGAILIWCFIYWVFKSISKAAILTSIFLILFFSFGQLLTALRSLAYAVGMLSPAIALIESTPAMIFWFLIWASLFAAIILLLRKTSVDLGLLDRFFSVFSVTLLLLVLWNGIQAYLSSDKVDRFVQAWRQADPISAGVSAPIPHSPNVYYIILDGYGRGDILKALYQYDNSSFYAFLNAKGFYVANASHSNYMQTALSFASSLNFTYLDDVALDLGAQNPSRTPLVAMATDNRMFQELRSHGYRVVTFASGSPYSEPEVGDIYMAPSGDLDTFENTLVDTTPIPLFLKLPFLKTQYEFDRERILYTLNHLADTTRLSGPLVVFAHILAPHPPFVFGAQGQAINPDRRFDYFDGSQFTSVGSQAEYVEGYRDQLAFLTERVEDAVNQILAQSSEPPIIIIQGDHGPGSMLDWTSDKNTNIPERLSILNAYYFPDHDYHQLYPSITPVNTFRILLDRLVGAAYPPLEDKSYYSTFANPYAFIDVTGRLTFDDPN